MFKRLACFFMVVCFLVSMATLALAEGFLGDLDKAMDDKEDRELKALEVTMKLPFHGELFTKEDFGDCTLLLHHTQFLKGRYFSAYVYSKMNKDAVKKIVAESQEKYNFSLEELTSEGVTFQMLKQFGSEALAAIIADDYRGQTLLLIEEGLETSGFPSVVLTKYRRCTTCSGGGKCTANCNNGKCKTCQGTGKPKCNFCKGNGLCYMCDGYGYSKYSSSGRKCSTCSGSGYCKHCESHRGFSKSGSCGQCNKGNCRTCGGKNICVKCGGDGNQY